MTVIQCIMLVWACACLAVDATVRHADTTYTRQHHRIQRTAYHNRPYTHTATYHASQPQQIMTTLTGIQGEMVVQWTTMEAYTTTPQCQYTLSTGSIKSWRNTPGTSVTFTDPYNHSDNNQQDVTRYIHTCTLTDLKPATAYQYQLADITDTTYTLTTLPQSSAIARLAVFGDFGLVNSQSIQMLTSMVKAGEIHGALHVGDFAYDLHTNNGKVGDDFINMVQPITSSIPVLTTAGNHEGKRDFDHYRHRYGLNGQLAMNSGAAKSSPHNLFYSVDIVSGDAIVHFLSVNTEFYFVYVDEYKEPDYTTHRQQQLDWIEKDLKTARENGADWVIMFGHRPMYCSNVYSEGMSNDCTGDTSILRHGVNGVPGLEDVANKYGVDLYLTAHEHSYERTLPVYRGKFQSYTDSHVYDNPTYMTHILTGSAGCNEYIDSYDEVFIPSWSVVRSSTYGFGVLEVHNSTHLYWSQYLDEGRAGTDDLWIIKTDKHRQTMQTA